MILDNEDILIQKTEEAVSIPNIAYNMFNDKLSEDDRHKCITMVFEYIKSYCNLPDHISYKGASPDFFNFFALDAKEASIYLIEIYRVDKRLEFSFYTDDINGPNYIKQLEHYGLTIAQYDQIKNKLIELFNLVVNKDIQTYVDTYISKYDFR